MRLTHTVKTAMVGCLLLMLVSCGGGSGGGGSVDNDNGNLDRSGKLTLTVKGKAYPVSGLAYSCDGCSGLSTDNAGTFKYNSTSPALSFKVGSKALSINGKSQLSHAELASNNGIAEATLAFVLLNADSDGNPNNGVHVADGLTDIDLNASVDELRKQLFKATGNIPQLTFEPVFGVNTESAQGEADTAGQPMPFVDVFRTARPFQELSGAATFDDNGWPTSVADGQYYARTKVLQGTMHESIPSGDYIVFYEGDGTLDFSNASKSDLPVEHADRLGYTLSYQTKVGDAEANAMSVNIRDIDSGNYIQNLRIIMPGGTCQSSRGEFAHSVHVYEQAECPSGWQYISFAERLKADRNAIIFNPAYLAFLEQFKVIRLMNLSESSHGINNCKINGVVVDSCLMEAREWGDRASMDDAVWGGSARTNAHDRKGVPVEVLTELANQLQRDIWYNHSHSDTDEYVRETAAYMAAHLSSGINVYVEYANEVWNNGFIAHHYANAQAETLGLDSAMDGYAISESRDETYYGRLKYYSTRAREMFALWEAEFGSDSRLVRVLGSAQGDKILTQALLDYEQAASGHSIDAIAIAPYFYGCLEKVGHCEDKPVLSEVSSVADVFDIINQPYEANSTDDVSALAGTLFKMGMHAELTEQYGVQLITYEGGQHYTIMGTTMGAADTARKTELRSIFAEANRDAQMKAAYTTLLEGWHGYAEQGASLFTLYTLPQRYYDYGNWGLKEHLNQSRDEAPKYDAVMEFQESIGGCWWSGKKGCE